MLNHLRLQARFLLPLVATIAVAAVVAIPLMDAVTRTWIARDLDARGELVATTLSDSVADAIATARPGRLRRLLDRTALDERLAGIGVCDADGTLVAASGDFPAALSCADARAIAASPDARVEASSGTRVVSDHALVDECPAVAAAAPGACGPPRSLGWLVLVHDLGFIAGRSDDTRRLLIGLLAALGLVLALVTTAAAQLSLRRWVASVRGLLRGEGLPPPRLDAPELAPLVDDLRCRLRDLQDEVRRGGGPDAQWTSSRLRKLLQTDLRGDQVIVVSNREPYLHEPGPDGPVVRRPASGLVTALEPVMRACAGTWIAHGSGGADRDAVDAHDRVAVPPGREDYTLRRVWLTAEEEKGYYYGFSNEGLWPLCHIAHVRPVFRQADWEAYRAVNRKFADAVVAEARSADPVVLVQDYHLALVPAMVRERLPQATIVTFWHIPWPNPESLAICPWSEELLRGLLGSTILGFHTRFHCRNFVESVDRLLEARIEQEHSTISICGEETLVQDYPISIAWPTSQEVGEWPGTGDCRERVLSRLGLSGDVVLALGVDRFDYTKGIIERLNAVERFLEKWPQWVGRFTFVQVASPTRTSIEEYRDFQERVARLVSRINERFAWGGIPAVHLLAEHHEHAGLVELYRAADVCVVTSLADGMNLVSKEFIAARDDEQGVLVLSRFTGAAQELGQALIVNPYHVEETADALHRAAEMTPAEQRERMASLRSVVAESNVFRWAGRMLSDAARRRLRDRVEARVRRHRPLAADR